jgi:tetratricopeptide (TPR) repeat protein
MTQSERVPPGFRVVDNLSRTRPVVRAEHLSTRRAVVLRRFDERERAVRHVRIVGRLREPFAPRLLSLVSWEGAWWVVTRWVPGESPVPGNTPPAFATDLLRALVEVHRRGIVHGDLSPGNVLCLPGGGVTLLDFEHAAFEGDEPPLEEQVATPAFVAPERRTGWPADPRSDLFSLAAVLDALGVRAGRARDAYDALASRRLSGRPARGDEVLARFVDAFGVGVVPRLSLEHVGWRRSAPTAARLARGIETALGTDVLSSQMLARDLLECTGGHRPLALRVWNSWIPGVTSDPWCAIATDALREPLSSLRQRADEITEAWVSSAPAAVRETAARLAPFGDELDWDEVRDVFEATKPTAIAERDDPAVEQLRNRGMLAPFRTATRVRRDRFRTPYLRTLAGSGSDPEANRPVHAAIARRIEESGGEPTPERTFRRATHLRLAGDVAAAREEAFGAGKMALDQGLRNDAVTFLEAAWEMAGGMPTRETVRGVPDWEDRAEAFATALTGMNRTDDAVVWLETLRELGDAPDTEVRYCAGMANVMQRRGLAEETLRFAEAGLERPEASARQRADLTMRRGQAFWRQGNLAAMEQEVGRAVIELGALRDGQLQIAILQMRGAACFGRQKLDDCLSHWTRALDLARALPHHFSHANAHQNLTAVRAARGQVSESREHLGFAIDVASRHGLPDIELACLSNLGWLELREERWNEAIRIWSAAADLALRQTSIPAALNALGAVARAHGYRGQLAEAARWIHRARRLAEETGLRGSIEALVVDLRLLELHDWFLGVPAEIEVVERVRHDLKRKQHSELHEEFRHLSAMDVLLRGGGPDRAEAALGTEPETVADAEGLVARIRGWHHLSHSRIELARDDLESALRANDRARAAFRDSRFGQAMTALERARMLPKHDLNEAAHMAATAFEMARSIGARWIEAEALALVARSGVR